MSEFCVKCNDFIHEDPGPEQVHDAWIHVEKEHGDECHTKEEIQKFIEYNLIDEMSGFEVMGQEWILNSKLENNIQHTKDTDSKINKVKDQINQLQTGINMAQAALTDLEAPYSDELTPIKARKQEIEEVFRGQHSETVKGIVLEPLIVQFRETKSLEIVDIPKAVEVLRVNEKLTEGIKGFDLKVMRKLKEADILPDDVAVYTSKINVYVKPKDPLTIEPEQPEPKPEG